MNAPAIMAERLAKSFRSRCVVDGVDIEIYHGEVFGFLGPNGAGKTTTMRLLLGYLRADAGRAEVLSGSPRTNPELWRRVGYLPGDLAIDPKVTGAEVFSFLARLRGGPGSAHVPDLCERLDFDPTKRFRTLSKGNRQKLGIIAAFMHEPEVLVLDEPTSGLDPLIQHAFCDLVSDAAARGAAVMLSSHVLPEVERVAARVGILRAGRLVAGGAMDDLLDHARHRLELRFAAPVRADTLARTAGVVEAIGRGRTLTVVIEGSVGPLLRAATTGRELVRVIDRDADLTETFRSFYEGNGSA